MSVSSEEYSIKMIKTSAVFDNVLPEEVKDEEASGPCDMAFWR